MHNKKVAFCTLGCKVNTYDSSMMGQILKDDGYEIVDFSDIADVYIINSCTVTGTGDKKSRQMISKAKKLNPKAIVCMSGCYSQTSPEEVTKLGVDLIIGTSKRKEIATLIQQAKLEKVVAIDDDLSEFEDVFVTSQEERTRGFVKIQDGCNRFCTYCIIPYARGKSRSRKMESIIKEIEQLSSRGYKEVVLTGIHLSSYGIDNDSSLIEAIEKVSEISGIKRIRLGSLEPLILTKDFCARLSKIDKICPSFHVSMQSGCDKTLKEMGRKYNSQQYYDFICNLRENFKNCSITTDVMVGFPNENEEDFEQSINFVKKIEFSSCHIFPYSIRKNTPAAKMENQVEKQTKTIRAKKMSDVCKKLEQKYIQANIGLDNEVLIEQEIEKGLYCGYTKNYIKVYVQGQDLFNKIFQVNLQKVYKDGVLGSIIKEMV